MKSGVDGIIGMRAPVNRGWEDRPWLCRQGRLEGQWVYERRCRRNHWHASAGEPWLGRSSVVVSSRKAGGPLVVWVRLMGGQLKSWFGSDNQRICCCFEYGRVVVGLGPLVEKLKGSLGNVSSVVRLGRGGLGHGSCKKGGKGSNVCRKEE